MANVKSAKKRIGTNEKARLRNRKVRSSYRTAIKSVRKALEAGDLAQAEQQLPRAISLINRTASKGVIHRSAASRTEARLVQAVNKARAAAQQ